MSDDLSIPNPTYRIPRHHRGMDPGTRRLALIAGGLGATLLAAVGGWSVIGHRSTTVYNSAGQAVARIDPFLNRSTVVYDSAVTAACIRFT